MHNGLLLNQHVPFALPQLRRANESDLIMGAAFVAGLFLGVLVLIDVFSRRQP